MTPTTWSDLAHALALRSPARVTDPVSSRAAVSLVIREGHSGLELLFIHRAEHPADPWSGQMAFPGGRSEPGESDLAATAIRETAEEIGVDLYKVGERLGALDEVRAMARGKLMDLAIMPFVFRVSGTPEARPNEEVRDVHWISLDGLLGPEWRSTMEYVHGGSTFHLPCIRWDRRVIWGLTFRMFTNLETLLGEATGCGRRTAAVAARPPDGNPPLEDPSTRLQSLTNQARDRGNPG